LIIVTSVNHMFKNIFYFLNKKNHSLYSLISLRSSFDFDYKTIFFSCTLKKNILESSKKYQKNILKTVNKMLDKNLGKVTVKYSIKNEEMERKNEEN